MRYPCLITTDIHLTDHPSTEYRWQLFPWINKMIEEHGIRSVAILGDVTDAKDNHSASLVNRVVSGIKSINCKDITILAGNHDWLRKGEEFFRFLNHLEGVRFITRPTEIEVDQFSELTLWLPYSKTPGAEWSGWDMSHYDYVFLHQTIRGAIASNGQRMDGEGVPEMNPRICCYSGDIHVPQTIGNLTYIGSPYHVHFGDDFEPRVLLLRRQGKVEWLRMPSPRRVVVKAESLSDLRRVKINEGDQVKLRMTLSEGDKHAWSRLKREAVALLEDRGAIVHGAELMVQKSNRRILIGAEADRIAYSPEELVYRFVTAEELGGDAFDAAMEVIQHER